VRKVLAQHPDEKTISLVAIFVSQLEKLWDVQLELPLGLEDEERRPGSKRGMARWVADRAIDMIRDRFGREAIGYGSLTLEAFVPYRMRSNHQKPGRGIAERLRDPYCRRSSDQASGCLATRLQGGAIRRRDCALLATRTEHPNTQVWRRQKDVKVFGCSDDWR